MSKAKSLKCTVCGRGFALPAHLGRHMRASHGKGGGAKAGRAPMRQAKRAGRPRAAATVSSNGEAVALASLQSYRDQLVMQREAIDQKLSSLDQAMSALSDEAPVARAKAPTRRVKRRQKRAHRAFRAPMSKTVVAPAHKPIVLVGTRPATSAVGAKPRAILHLGAPPAAKPIATAAPRGGSLKDYVTRVLTAAGKPMEVKTIADQVVKNGFKSKNKTLAKSVGIILAGMKNAARVRRGVFQIRK